MFTDGVSQVIVPLWLLTLHPSALSFGIVIGARSFLPIFLSIHGGVLMDRLGVRRVMLFFALVGLALPVLYPMLPFVAVAVVLQLILGLTTTMSWVGAQTVAGQTTKGNPRFIGRLSFSNRFGAFAGPLLAGITWDTLGQWGGFGLMFFWSAMLLICALMLPKDAARLATRADRKSTRLNSSHTDISRMPSSA